MEAIFYENHHRETDRQTRIFTYLYSFDHSRHRKGTIIRDGKVIGKLYNESNAHSATNSHTQ